MAKSCGSVACSVWVGGRLMTVVAALWPVTKGKLLWLKGQQ